MPVRVCAYAPVSGGVCDCYYRHHDVVTARDHAPAEEWVVRPPKTKEGKEVQYINIYFDENGIVTGAKRVNPAKEPPMSPDGTLNREETMGTIPGITANKQTVRAKSK